MNKTKLPSIATISLAATLLLTSGLAQADNLDIAGSSAISFAGYDGQPAEFTGLYSNGLLGTLVANGPVTIVFTYLGNESGYNNSFSFLGSTLNESNAIGDSTASFAIDAGQLNFSFLDNQGSTFSNGSLATPVLGFAILNGNLTPVTGPNFGPFDYVLGFNDSSNGDADYDDFVVGVKFTPLSPVPLPASLPLMAVALGLFTFARSRV